MNQNSHIHRNELSELQNKVDIYTETSPTVQILIFPPVTQTLKTANYKTAMSGKIQTITSVQKN